MLLCAPASAGPQPPESNTVCTAELRKNDVDAGTYHQQHQDSFGPSLSELAFWMEIEPGPNADLEIGVTPSTQRQVEAELCEPLRYGQGRHRSLSFYGKHPNHIFADSDRGQMIKQSLNTISICDDDACYLYFDLQRCLLFGESKPTILGKECHRPGCTPVAGHLSEHVLLQDM